MLRGLSGSYDALYQQAVVTKIVGTGWGGDAQKLVGVMALNLVSFDRARMRSFKGSLNTEHKITKSSHFGRI